MPRRSPDRVVYDFRSTRSHSDTCSEKFSSIALSQQSPTAPSMDARQRLWRCANSVKLFANRYATSFGEGNGPGFAVSPSHSARGMRFVRLRVSILMAPKWTKRAWPGRKWPDARVRSTEIYQTRPPFVGLRHDKFRSFRERGRPGGHFLKGRGAMSGHGCQIRWQRLIRMKNFILLGGG